MERVPLSCRRAAGGGPGGDALAQARGVADLPQSGVAGGGSGTGEAVG
jgi:hypothetical protein